MTIKDDPQEIARVQMLNRIKEDLEDYLLDHCPDNEDWEEFDPQIDALRTTVQGLLRERT